MDYEKMSPAELRAEYARRQATPEPIAGAKEVTPYDHMTRSELEYEYGKRQEKRPSGTVQEMHPDFSEADRFVVKNFSNDPDHAVSYLKSKHPNLEISHKNGEYRARAKGSNEDYKVLDPNTDLFSMGTVRDAGMDITDAAYDIASGIGTSMATAAGGVFGNLPGAALVGAGANTVSETLRQGIGALAGVNQGINGTDIAVSGALGAASPLVFGTGAGATQIGNRLIQKGAATAEGLSEKLLAQRGGLKRIYDSKYAPFSTLGSLASGATEDALKTLSSRWDEFNSILTRKGGSRAWMAENMGDIKGAFTNLKAKANADIDGSALQAAGEGKTVDVGKVLESLERQLAGHKKAATKGGNTDISQEPIEKIQNLIETHFMGNGTELVPVTKTVPSGYLDEIGKPTFKEVTEMVEQPARKKLTTLDPVAALNLSRDLAENAGVLKMKPNPLGATQFLTQGKARGDRVGILAAKDAKSLLDTELKPVLGERWLLGKTKYGEAVNAEKEFMKTNKTPRQFFANLRNADIKSNLPVKDFFGEVEEMTKKPLDTMLRPMAQTLDQFAPGRSSFFSKDNLRAVPLSVGLGTGGYFAGSQLNESNPRMGGITGGALGGMAGALLGSPRMMQAIINTEVKSGKRAEQFKSLNLSDIVHGLPDSVKQRLPKNLLEAISPIDEGVKGTLMQGAAGLGMGGANVVAPALTESAWNYLKPKEKKK